MRVRVELDGEAQEIEVGSRQEANQVILEEREKNEWRGEDAKRIRYSIEPATEAAGSLEVDGPG